MEPRRLGANPIDVADLNHRLLSAFPRLGTAVFEYLPDELWILFIGLAPFLDRLERGNDRIRRPAFALDTADAGSGAALINLGERLGAGEDFMQVANRAYVGISRGRCAECGPGSVTMVLSFWRISASGSVSRMKLP